MIRSATVSLSMNGKHQISVCLQITKTDLLPLNQLHLILAESKSMLMQFALVFI